MKPDKNILADMQASVHSAKTAFRSFFGIQKAVEPQKNKDYKTEPMTEKTVTPNGYVLSKTTAHGEREIRAFLKKLRKVDKDPVIALQKAARIPGFFVRSRDQ